MKTPEASVKEHVKTFLKRRAPDCWYFMPVPFGYGVRGLPDFVGCYRGRFFGIETKRIGSKKPVARRAQELIHKLITAAGGTIILTNCVEDLENHAFFTQS